MSHKGLVFNIQRYSVHDGGGIRTIIFLKGCPLACPWCANPESRKAVSPTKWVKNGVKETVGEWWEIDDLVDEVMKDEVFFRTSGGGVTLSGGEVLMQYEFAAEILTVFHEMGVHTAIETTGCFPLERIQLLAPFLNQVLFDFKVMNPQMAKEVIGIDVDLVKQNFEFLVKQKHIQLIPRIPLIPGYTISEQNLAAIADYLSNFTIREVHLLPFHQYGSRKYDYLGWKYQMSSVATLSPEQIQFCRHIFEQRYIKANIDGLE